MRTRIALALTLALALLPVMGIPAPERPAEPVHSSESWDVDTATDRPARQLVVTAEDGTTTTNVIAPDGTVTGWVTLPDGSTFGFDGESIQEDDPRWNCMTMGNHVCGKDN